MTLHEIYACNLNTIWLWEHGDIPRDKMRGAALSQLSRFDGMEDEYDNRIAVLNARVGHGWVMSVTGDLSSCGWDVTTMFLDEEPTIVDGQWTGEGYDGDGTLVTKTGEVVDGPHVATWLLIA